MMKLIRNCSHDNEVATFYRERNREKSICKASSSLIGIEQVEQEINGWTWYQSRRYLSANNGFCKIVAKRENYIRVEIQYIEGCKAKYSKGIQKNAELIDDVIQHYCNIWSDDKENYPPLHGDLSIDNVISNKDGVHIIDWEHFSFEGAPFGFDAYNLLFEQLWFAMKGRKKLRRNELDVLLGNIRTIRSASIGFSDLHDKPLSSLQNFIRINCRIWRGQIYRLPVLLFDDQTAAIVDEMIRLNI